MIKSLGDALELIGHVFKISGLDKVPSLLFSLKLGDIPFEENMHRCVITFEA